MGRKAQNPRGPVGFECPNPKKIFFSFKFLSENFSKFFSSEYVVEDCYSFLSLLVEHFLLWRVAVDECHCCMLWGEHHLCCGWACGELPALPRRAVRRSPCVQQQHRGRTAKRGCSRAARNFCDFSDFYLTRSQNVVRGLRLRLDLDASKGYKHRQSCDAVLVLRDFSIFTILWRL